MSTSTKIASISESNRKVLKTHNVLAVVNRYINLPDGENFKPSDVKVGIDLAKSGMGARFTADSFAQGLVSLSAMYAWGQKPYAALVAGLPPLSVIAFDKSASFLKNGAGCNSEALRHAVVTALEYCIALPKTVKKEKSLPDNSAIDSTSTVVPEIEEEKAETDEEKADRLALVVKVNEEKRIAAETSEKLAAETQAIADKQANDSAPQFLDLWLTNFQNNEVQARDCLREMAKIAGYRLVKLSSKKAA